MVKMKRLGPPKLVLHERDKVSKESDLLKATLQTLIDDFCEFENGDSTLECFVECMGDAMTSMVRRRAELNQICARSEERAFYQEMELAIPGPSI